MKNKPIIIVPGETESVFFEIFFKSLKKYHMRSPIILIASSRLLKNEIKKLKFKKKIKIIENQSLNSLKLENRSIYLLNVNYRYKFEKKR